MAFLDTSIQLDMNNWNLGNPAAGVLGDHDISHFEYALGDRVFDFSGYNMKYATHDGVTFPYWGHVTDMTVTDNGTEVVSLSDISISVVGLAAAFLTGHPEAFEAWVLRHKDTISGSKDGDVLNAFSGNDIVRGFGGNDLLIGGFGQDHLSGGTGHDTFAYWNAWESTDRHYDTIEDFDAHRDMFSFQNQITGIDPTVTTGHLSNQNFDLKLATAATSLQAYHAMLFTPDGGKYVGQTFLLVDQNGTAGYQVGEDFVVKLADTSMLAGFDAGNFTTS